MMARGSPIFTTALGWASTCFSTPATGEGTSTLTLSVITSTMGSYSATWSPSCFIQRAMVPSTTVSATSGMTMVTVMGAS
jgi:hypothetical protein